MARALVTFERQPDRQWKPTVVWLGTPKRLDARALPGSGQRDAFVAAMLSQASRPFATGDERGTWEDWIGWAADALANGFDSWAVEVEPEPTIDALYKREVLGVDEAPPEPQPQLRTPEGIPTDLGGYKKVSPA